MIHIPGTPYFPFPFMMTIEHVTLLLSLHWRRGRPVPPHFPPPFAKTGRREGLTILPAVALCSKKAAKVAEWPLSPSVPKVRLLFLKVGKVAQKVTPNCLPPFYTVDAKQVTLPSSRIVFIRFLPFPFSSCSRLVKTLHEPPNFFPPPPRGIGDRRGVFFSEPTARGDRAPLPLECGRPRSSRRSRWLPPPFPSVETRRKGSTAIYSKAICVVALLLEILAEEDRLPDHIIAFHSLLPSFQNE